MCERIEMKAWLGQVEVGAASANRGQAREGKIRSNCSNRKAETSMTWHIQKIGKLSVVLVVIGSTLANFLAVQPALSEFSADVIVTENTGAFDCIVFETGKWTNTCGKKINGLNDGGPGSTCNDWSCAFEIEPGSYVMGGRPGVVERIATCFDPYRPVPTDSDHYDCVIF